MHATHRFIQLCEEAEQGGSGLAAAHEALLREIGALELQVAGAAGAAHLQASRVTSHAQESCRVCALQVGKVNAALTANAREQQTYAERQQQLEQEIEQVGECVAC
jgi:hypothetical protein